MSIEPSLRPTALGRPTADFLSTKVRNMPPSGIRRFFDMLAEMKDVISLTIGEPDFTPPSRSPGPRSRACRPVRRTTPPMAG
jgi:hypothetical protein